MARSVLCVFGPLVLFLRDPSRTQFLVGLKLQVLVQTVEDAGCIHQGLTLSLVLNFHDLTSPPTLLLNQVPGLTERRALVLTEPTVLRRNEHLWWLNKPQAPKTSLHLLHWTGDHPQS